MRCPNCGGWMFYDWEIDVYLCDDCMTSVVPQPRFLDWREI